jgi:haloacetate dehalogenase
VIIWGAEFLGKAASSPAESWRRSFVPDAVAVEVPGGHFGAEESPEETLMALRELMNR